ncbi:MAG TPA: hypothetical protein VHY91_19990 [Pirellulales bacterium]|jgi:hypothetical protein|nr:hypothetical protein [Pirellulales bacterium]
MASFEASLPNDPVAPIPDAPDSDAEPVAGKPAAGDSATPPSCMPNGGCACLGDCRRGFQTFVGVEALFLAPTQNTGGGTNYSVFNGSPTTPTNSYNSSSVSGMIVTPRLWLGIMGECWGVGVRYWQFNNGAGGPVFPSGTNAGLASAGFLKLQTFDLEAIRRIYYGNSQLWFSVGSRYAQFSHGSSISSTDFIGGGTATASAASGAGFNGTGITTGLFGLTPIGCSCWNLFYGGRVSYLWDTSAGAFAQSSAAFSSSGGSGAATHYATLTGGNSGLFIGEVQLGLQYNHALRCFPGIAFFRIAAEYQYWHVNNGLDANSFSGAGYYSSGTGVLNSVVATTTANGNSTLGLVGFGLSTGFMW